MPSRLLAVVFATAFASVADAATFDVTNPTEFQTALTMAQANGETDQINVDDGTYDISAIGTLTYVAISTENFGLTIEGTDSDFVTLDGGMQVPILRIDTTAVTSDGGVFIEVLNMTMQNGNAVGTPNDGGAVAILTDESLQPAEFATVIVVAGSEFYDNMADDDGGAIYVRGHAVEGLVLADLTIDGNQAGGDGGGAYVAGGQFTTPIIVDDIFFFNNVAQGNGGGLDAEGFDPDTPTEDRALNVDLFDITFFNNTSFNGGGADIAANSTAVELVGFVDNFAGNEGGGLRIRQDFTTLVMVNSGFVGNVAMDEGGGLAVAESIFANVTLTNNTFTENEGTNFGDGAFIAIDGSTSIASIYNNIIGDDIQSVALYVDNNALGDIPATVEIFNNNIESFLVTQPGSLSEGNNINEDPMFVDIALRPEPDPRLQAGSLLIDMGDNNAPAVPSFDFEGDARPFDGDGDTVATVDIGMDEFTGTLAQNADLSVTKSDDPDPVTEGGNITYTVTVTNNGPGPATSVTLVDTLDSLVSFVSATPTQGTCSESMGTVTCNLGSLANNASATVTIIVATPDVPDTTVITNTAGVSATETDPVSTNDSATEQTTIVPAGPAMADLAVTKSDAPDPVFSGGPQITYSLTVTNNGPDDATNVVLTDTLPAEVVFDSATATAGTCLEASGVVTCDIGALALNASATVTIVVTPNEVTDPTVITNNASVTATEIDPTPANDTVAETTTVNPPSADMSVDISSTPAEPLINEQVTYSVTVTNAGPSDNTGVVVTVVLPPNATFNSVTIDQGTCDVDMGTVTCTIGDVAAGVSVLAEIVVTAPGETTTLTLSATIVADVADPTPGNNASSQDVTVIDVVDLVIQGTSDGTGSVGWIELLLLLSFAGVVAARTARGLAKRGARTLLPAFAVGMLSIVALAATPDHAHAQDDWYVGIAAGTTSLDYSASDLTNDLANLGWTINNPSVDDSNNTWKYYAGYSFNEYFAVEAGFADLGEVVTQFGATIPPNQIDALLSDTLSVHPYMGDGWFAAGVVKWPLVPDSFSIVGRAGLFAWESDTEVRVIQGGTGSVADGESGTDGMFGAGIEWQLTEQWSLTADYERYKLNEWLGVPSIGIRYTFR